MEKTALNFSQPIFFWIALLLYFIALIAFTARNETDGNLYSWLWISIFATASLAYYLIRRENSWKIKLLNKNTYVLAFKNVPDAKTVNQFIDTIFSTRNDFLRENYLTLDKNLNYEEQYKNLKWLLHIEAISKCEYHVKYDELQSLFNKNQKTIGFDR